MTEENIKEGIPMPERIPESDREVVFFLAKALEDATTICKRLTSTGTFAVVNDMAFDLGEAAVPSKYDYSLYRDRLEKKVCQISILTGMLYGTGVLDPEQVSGHADHVLMELLRDLKHQTPECLERIYQALGYINRGDVLITVL